MPVQYVLVKRIETHMMYYVEELLPDENYQQVAEEFVHEVETGVFDVPIASHLMEQNIYSHQVITEDQLDSLLDQYGDKLY